MTSNFPTDEQAIQMTNCPAAAEHYTQFDFPEIGESYC